MPSEKKCIKCNIYKDIDSFGIYKTSRNIGRRGVCKSCFVKQKREYTERNKGRWKTDNKTESARNSKAKWKLNNLDRVKEQNKRYEAQNRERRNARRKERRINDPSYKIGMNLRRAIIRNIRGSDRGGSAIRDLGCTIDQLRNYLETRFYQNPRTGKDMSWENYGHKGWHIDHIITLASFDLTNREQFLQACHYSNLQPLWWFDNLSKGAKI